MVTTIRQILSLLLSPSAPLAFPSAVLRLPHGNYFTSAHHRGSNEFCERRNNISTGGLREKEEAGRERDRLKVEFVPQSQSWWMREH